jgi:endonuclease-3
VRDEDIHTVVGILRDEHGKWKQPIVTEIAGLRDPFRVLVTTVISSRTKDDVTREAAGRLLGLADNPRDMLRLDVRAIEKALYPAGFYRMKARNILEICRVILHEKAGRVPDDIEELTRLPGVGRKTANLVVTLGYGKPGICVDTHVHRISNRLGYVSTTTPEKTEFALREKLPEEYWIEYNDLLVTYGQNVCTPISPFCSVCAIGGFCDRVGVQRHR